MGRRGFTIPKTAQAIYTQFVRVLSLDERLRLATLILNDLIQQNASVLERKITWSEQDQLDLVIGSLQYAATLFFEGKKSGSVTFSSGDGVTGDFPEVTGCERCSALVLSSDTLPLISDALPSMFTRGQGVK